MTFSRSLAKGLAFSLRNVYNARVFAAWYKRLYSGHLREACCSSKKRCFQNTRQSFNRGISDKTDRNGLEEKPSGPKMAEERVGEKLLDDVHKSCVQELSEAGVSEPEESVDLIIAHICGKKMIHEVDLNVKVSQKVASDIQTMCHKRLQRVPVQYIIGEWDFLDMTLYMEPGILIPRPETEELAGFIVEDLSNKGTDRPCKVLDIGCGSGALSLYLLHCLPNISCVALDKSPKACSLTVKNATVHNLQNRLQVVHGDIFQETCIQSLMENGPFDMIVSNPPYIPAKDMEKLEQEVARFEDFDALCGGSDGLDVVRQILCVSKNLLKPFSGLLWLEVDLSHPVQIEKIVQGNPQHGLKYLSTVQDFTKRGRFCKLQITS